ncbi:YncE family protein [Amycolatopsis benzoatilytica]|uniref:YncE family protein n=1 Tax=Amycolatopsis benzoatilytica TaxID=346045 RepID=UPI0003719E1A|nr:YncE family protein [Amycolatopsis benzoatilytica]
MAIVQVGGNLSALAVSPVTGLVYAADPQSGSVVVLDPDQARVVSVLAAGGEPSDVAVDASRIYVANPPGGTVAVFDSQTHQLLSVVSAGAGASALALDGPANLVYAVSSQTGTFAVIDSISLTLQKLLPAPKPGLAGIALDRGRRRAYCTSPGTNTVEICDLDAKKFSGSVDVGASPTGIGVHEPSGAVFVANSAIHHLSIVDGSTRTQTKTILLRSEASSLAVHQGTDTVYTNGGQNGLSRVDGRAELLTGELSLGINPGDVAVDQRTRTVYVSDPLHGTISIVRDF